MRQSVLKTELIGIAVISMVGSVLHFVFDWSGHLAPVGVISPVNESVFEHLKLTFWPTLLYAAITYRFLRKSTSNFLIAKTASIYVMPAAIIAISYSSTGITGNESLITDILFFIVAVALGQITSYKLLTKGQLPRHNHILAVTGLVVIGAIFILLAYYPPHWPLFMDHNTGT